MSEYVVMRTYTRSDKKTLWKVMSRPLKDMVTAEDWKRFEESESKNPKHKFFIVKMMGAL